MDDNINTHLAGDQLTQQEYIEAMAAEYEWLAKRFAEYGEFKAVAEKHLADEEKRTGFKFGCDTCYWTEESAKEAAESHFLDFTKISFKNSTADLKFAYMMNSI